MPSARQHYDQAVDDVRYLTNKLDDYARRCPKNQDLFVIGRLMGMAQVNVGGAAGDGVPIEDSDEIRSVYHQQERRAFDLIRGCLRRGMRKS